MTQDTNKCTEDCKKFWENQDESFRCKVHGTKYTVEQVQHILDSASTLTLINGNDRRYTVELPEIWLCYETNQVALDHIEDITGLKFERVTNLALKGVHRAVMTRKDQLLLLLMRYNYCTRRIGDRIYLGHTSEHIHDALKLNGFKDAAQYLEQFRGLLI